MRSAWAIALAGTLTLTACGSHPGVVSKVATPQFDGKYTLAVGPVLRMLAHQLAREPDPKRRASLHAITLLGFQMYRSLTIREGVIRTGGFPVQEFSIQAATLEGNVLSGRAIWHEDVNDPGDMSEVQVRLVAKGDALSFTFGDAESGQETLEYVRD